MAESEETEPPHRSGGSGLPVAFVVPGIPRSAQARKREHWTAAVKGQATNAWSGAPLRGEVSVVIVYFYTDRSPDVDNLAKPILDAMKGSIIEDDGMVSQLLARKTELSIGLNVPGAPPMITIALRAREDFVYVKVDGRPDHGILP